MGSNYRLIFCLYSLILVKSSGPDPVSMKSGVKRTDSYSTRQRNLKGLTNQKKTKAKRLRIDVLSLFYPLINLYIPSFSPSIDSLNIGNIFSISMNESLIHAMFSSFS